MAYWNIMAKSNQPEDTKYLPHKRETGQRYQIFVGLVFQPMNKADVGNIPVVKCYSNILLFVSDSTADGLYLIASHSLLSSK